MNKMKELIMSKLTISCLCTRFRMVLSVLFLTLAAATNLHAQQKFPYGVVTANQPFGWAKTNNFSQIKDLGVNFILHQLTPATADSVEAQGLKIVGCNYDSEDFIATFTSGISTIYKPMGSNTTGYTENLIFQKGEEESDGWKITKDYGRGHIIYNGPNVSQYPNYIPNYLSIFGVTYNVRFKMKVDDVDEARTEVCRISVMKKCQGDYFEEIAGRDVYTDELTTEYSDIVLNYSLDRLTVCEAPHVWNTDGPRPHPSPLESDYNESYALLEDGIHYRIYYYATKDIYIQSVECVDELIWKYYREDSPAEFWTKLNAQVDTFMNHPAVIGFSPIDEPHTIDLYKPFRVMQEALDYKGSQPLYPFFYPEWNGIRNGNPTFQEFKDSANPRLMNFYYLPFWNSDVRVPYTDSLMLVYWFLADRLQEASEIFPGYHYTAQSQSFIDPRSLPNYKLRWRKPAYYELSATLHLAMATGSRGLVLSNYYSYPTLDANNPFYRTESLVYNTDTTNNTFLTTGLYDSLKILFKPRIQGSLGDRLMKLQYTNQYLRERKFNNVVDKDSSASSAKRLGMMVYYNGNDSLYMHHVGFFDDSVDAVNHRYFYLVNLRPKKDGDSVKNIKVLFNRPSSQTFLSYRLRDIEGGTDTSFGASLLRTVPVRGGDGRLFEVLPSIRYGGSLAVDDTVKGTEVLTEVLTVPAGKKLYIKENYTLNSNMSTGTSGKISGAGYVFLESGATISATDWSAALVKSRSGNYPKLVWAAYPGQGTIQNYKIFRKKQTGGFQLIGTVGTAIQSFTDTETSIIEGTLQNNETFAEYFIQASVIPSEGGTVTMNTDTISYDRVEGEIPEKEGQSSPNTQQFVYSLEQNYPNPFNPNTIFKYSIKEEGHTKLSIYDISGQLIKVLVNEVQKPGEYTFSYAPAAELPSGIYFYELISGSFRSVKKSIFLK